MCSALFANEDVKWAGNLQVRALHLCGHEDGRSTHAAADDLQKLLQQSRRLVDRRASSTIPMELYVELFFADCIFEPSFKAVHGDFALAQLTSDGMLSESLGSSGKGPYGSTGLYEKEEKGPFQRIEEDAFLAGVQRKLLSIST